jgi:hypothetical protein
MFRIGSLLFIPAYLTVILYRHLASEGPGGNLFVMIGGHSSCDLFVMLMFPQRCPSALLYDIVVLHSLIRPFLSCSITVSGSFCGVPSPDLRW